MAANKLSKILRWVGKSREWVESLLDSVGNHPTIRCVVILGSAIRPHGHRRSDFDLLIVYDGNQRPKLAPPTEIDVRRYARNDLHKKIDQADEVLCWALKFGIPIHDPDGIWAELLQTYGNRIPLPSKPEAMERARKSLKKAYEMLDHDDEDGAADLILASLTQFVRAELITRGVFPASRPELPDQLRKVSPDNALAGLLEEAMYGDTSPFSLCDETSRATELYV